MIEGVHAYGGVEHRQPGLFADCLLCELELLREALADLLALAERLGQGLDPVAPEVARARSLQAKYARLAAQRLSQLSLLAEPA